MPRSRARVKWAYFELEMQMVEEARVQTQNYALFAELVRVYLLVLLGPVVRHKWLSFFKRL